MPLDLDKWIEKLKKTEYLAEDELKALCDYVGRAPGSRCWAGDAAAGPCSLVLACWRAGRLPRAPPAPSLPPTRCR